MKKLRRVSKDRDYAEFYSSDYLIRSQKNLKVALVIIAVAFFAFIISMACVFYLYPLS